MEEEKRKSILAFARQIGETNRDPMETAQERGWLNDNGAVTEEGERLLKGLDDDKESRTVLRGNY